MDYARPIMWNIPEWAEIAFYLLIPVVLLALVAGIAWRVRKWFVGRAEPGEEKLRKLRARRRTRSLTTWSPAPPTVATATVDDSSADPDPPLSA